MRLTKIPARVVTILAVLSFVSRPGATGASVNGTAILEPSAASRMVESGRIASEVRLCVTNTSPTSAIGNTLYAGDTFEFRLADDCGTFATLSEYCDTSLTVKSKSGIAPSVTDFLCEVDPVSATLHYVGAPKPLVFDEEFCLAVRHVAAVAGSCVLRYRYVPAVDGQSSAQEERATLLTLNTVDGRRLSAPHAAMMAPRAANAAASCPLSVDPCLVGPPGPTGPQGEPGEIGPVGSQGAAGPPGDRGPAGLTGDQGEPGATGPTGANGANGATGPAGTNGATGPTGANGANGATGPAGANGVTGPTGANGANGANGTNGATGPAGANGANGANGATGPAGANGANGATGPTGANGANGATGPAGANGANGATGPAGANGANGANGATGPPGANGANGATGPAGTNGAVGPTGPVGPQGPAGMGLSGCSRSHAEIAVAADVVQSFTLFCGSAVHAFSCGMTSCSLGGCVGGDGSKGDLYQCGQLANDPEFCRCSMLNNTGVTVTHFFSGYCCDASGLSFHGDSGRTREPRYLEVETRFPDGHTTVARKPIRD